MRTSDFIARTITQQRALVWCGMTLLTVACVTVLVTSLQFDSEIFNVLRRYYGSRSGVSSPESTPSLVSPLQKGRDREDLDSRFHGNDDESI